MRFAWLRKNTPQVDMGQGGAVGVGFIRTLYNAAWWLPILLTYLGTIDYNMGFAIFGIVTLIRGFANLYLNNVVDPARAESFPFRA